MTLYYILSKASHYIRLNTEYILLSICRSGELKIVNRAQILIKDKKNRSNKHLFKFFNTLLYQHCFVIISYEFTFNMLQAFQPTASKYCFYKPLFLLPFYFLPKLCNSYKNQL